MKRILSLLLALMVMAGRMAALDLPVKRVKGKQYYYHKVKKGESLYGISKNLGLSVEEIVRNNPAAADGVKKGDLLIFSVEEYSQAAPEPAPVDTVAVVEEEAVAPAKNPSIAVLLPFGAEAQAPSRSNRLALDFYKGLLIAADSLSSRPGLVEIVARDIDGMRPDALRSLVESDSALAHAAVIIGPDEEAALNAISAAAATTGTYVFNALCIRDTTYLTNPCAMQASVPQKAMYRLAVEGLMEEYPGYRPVIIRSATARNEKEAFTEYLTECYRAAGTEPLQIEYQTNLLNADLETLPVDAAQKYVIVPSSGTLAEFNRFAYVLLSFRDRLKAEAAQAAGETGEPVEPADVAVFGYPDWTAFRGDALDVLHRLGATVYSRFFDDFNGFSVRNINSDFKRWYGAPLIESIPSSGILGYDCGCFLIKAIRSADGTFDPSLLRPFSGIQSTFDFRRSGEGYVNEALYIIKYLAGGRMAARVQ